MKIPCPNCNQRLDIPEELAGQIIECPICNGSITIPTSDQPASEQSEANIDKKTEIPSLQSRSKPKPSPKPSHSSKIKKINPVSRMINERSDDGALHDFLPDKLMIGIPTAITIISLLISIMAGGIPGLVLNILSLIVITFINAFLFIKTANWVCGRYIHQNPAISTVFFTSSISGLLGSLIGMAGISDGGLTYLISLFAIQTYIFELRLKEGYIEALKIAVLMFILNIIISIGLGCILGIFAVGTVASQM